LFIWTQEQLGGAVALGGRVQNHSLFIWTQEQLGGAVALGGTVRGAAK